MDKENLLFYGLLVFYQDQKLMSDLIILDDGFQSKHLYKDLNFLVIDGNQKFGNKKIFPAGPLRESINSAFKRTNAIILIDFVNKNDGFFKNNKIPYFYFSSYKIEY